MTETVKDLPSGIQDQIVELPEYSYGVNRVTVTLDDGTEIADVYVAWGKQVVRVGTSADVQFDPLRVVGVRNQP